MAIRNVLEVNAVDQSLGSMQFNVYVVASAPEPELAATCASLVRSGKQLLLALRDLSADLDDLETLVLRPLRFEGIELLVDEANAQRAVELSNAAAMRGWSVVHTVSPSLLEELYLGGPKLLEQTKQVPAANSITWLNVRFDRTDIGTIAKTYVEELAAPLHARYVDTGVSDPAEFLAVGLTIPDQSIEGAVALVDAIRESYPKFGSVHTSVAGATADVAAWGTAMWDVLHGGAELHIVGTALPGDYFVN